MIGMTHQLEQKILTPFYIALGIAIKGSEWEVRIWYTIFNEKAFPVENYFQNFWNLTHTQCSASLRGGHDYNQFKILIPLKDLVALEE